MDLFNSNETPNILPFDGEVIYYGPVINISRSIQYYHKLLESIEWKNDKAVIFGKHIVTNRKVALYAEEAFQYTYSNKTKIAIPFTQDLLELKSLIENLTKEKYNTCLLNLYHDGSEGMAWHSDGEKDLKENGAIASLSFGAERKFSFKHKVTKQRITTVFGKREFNNNERRYPAQLVT